MVVNNCNELTEHEEELYDRQIRLWGLEAQKRLRSARVLVIGMNGLGAEVMKNIVLAGVKSLTMLDNNIVNELDSHSQFLAPPDSVGRNRAEASLERAQELNPLVSVSADPDSVDQKSDEYFAQWEVIVASGLTTAQYVRINSLARANGVKFFCGDIFGFFGYLFADLQSHEYVEDVIRKISKPNPNGPGMKLHNVVNTEKGKIEFPSLDDALEIDFTSEEHLGKLRNMDPSYFILKVLLKFRDIHKRNPNPENIEEEMKELIRLRDEELSNLPYSKDKIPDSIFRLVFSQLSPACAIVGGVLGQEIIKAVSKKDAPINNMFFFDPLTNNGQIICVGN